jgi:hypothetical protein
MAKHRRFIRSRNEDGTIREVEITEAQEAELKAGRPITYTPREPTILVDESGEIIMRESAPADDE